jgi:hypothetical protein
MFHVLYYPSFVSHEYKKGQSKLHIVNSLQQDNLGRIPRNIQTFGDGKLHGNVYTINLFFQVTVSKMRVCRVDLVPKHSAVLVNRGVEVRLHIS